MTASGSDSEIFVIAFVRAVDSAARVFDYEPVEADVVAQWLDRIPPSTRDLLAMGLRSGIIAPGPTDATFAIAGGGIGKGPYSWFSRNRVPAMPSPNWEYFFQAAEFIRVRSALRSDVEIRFEDGLMDVSVYRGGRLIWYVEVKKSEGQIPALLRDLEHHAPSVDLTEPDRGKDALRKAKYLVRHRPAHLSLVGGEARRHFDVAYPSPTSFALVERPDGPEVALV